MKGCLGGAFTLMASLIVASSIAGPSRADEKIDFARDIRPILSDACFLCHGPDDGQRKADLRLDTRDGALGNRDAGAPFVPGKPDESEAWVRITATDATMLMPPPKSGQRLSSKQIGLITALIEQGRKWHSHAAL